MFLRLGGSWEGRTINISPAAGHRPYGPQRPVIRSLAKPAQAACHSKRSLAAGRGKWTMQPQILGLHKSTQRVGTQRKADFQFWMSATSQLWLRFIAGVHKAGWPWGRNKKLVRRRSKEE